MVKPLSARFGSQAVLGFQDQRIQSFLRGDEKDLIDLYKLDNGGKIPRSLDALTQKRKQFDWAFMDNIPDDPWGNPYEYRPEGTDSYRIISYGPDGNPGSDDDLHGPAPR